LRPRFKIIAKDLPLGKLSSSISDVEVTVRMYFEKAEIYTSFNFISNLAESNYSMEIIISSFCLLQREQQSNSSPKHLSKRNCFEN
jgi:hypothetical protein